MRTSSPLPPSFGFDPTGLGPSAALPTHRQRLSAARAAPADETGDDIRPTLWIGRDGHEEDDASVPRFRSPGSMVVTTACIGIALAALAYVLDLPLS